MFPKAGKFKILACQKLISPQFTKWKWKCTICSCSHTLCFQKKANSKSWPAKNCVHLNPKWKWICTSANTFYFYYVFEIRTVIMLSLSKKCIYMNFYYLERGVEGPPARRLLVYVYAYVSYIYYQIIPASGLCVGREVGGHLWNVVLQLNLKNKLKLLEWLHFHISVC